LHTQVGLFSYNATMTSSDLWRAVGRELRDEREQQGLKWFHVSTKAKPTKIDPKTLQAIERGAVGTLDTVERYAQVLGLSIVDVVSRVLKTAEERPTREAVALLRCFEQLDGENRTLVLWTARRLLEQQPPSGEPGGATTPALAVVLPRKKPPTK
jgi:transcriptional regulator with XRE-family HTH domain